MEELSQITYRSSPSDLLVDMDQEAPELDGAVTSGHLGDDLPGESSAAYRLVAP
jgi:hypothetical protein